MGNPLWSVGVSGNPAGRKPGSKRTVKSTISRFLLRNCSLKELQKNFELLKEGRERLEFILKLMPYHVAQVQADSLTTHEVEELYKKLEQTVKDAAKTKQAI